MGDNRYRLSFHLCWMQRQVFSNFEMHPVYLGQKARCREMVVGGIGLYTAQVRDYFSKESRSPAYSSTGSKVSIALAIYFAWLPEPTPR